MTKQIQIRRPGTKRDLSVIRNAQPGSAIPATTILMRSHNGWRDCRRVSPTVASL
jgi:hypothetical protein